MKQLKIHYTVYSQKDNPIHSAVFETTFYDELPATILRSALNLLKHAAGDGYYVITDISTLNLTGL